MRVMLRLILCLIFFSFACNANNNQPEPSEQIPSLREMGAKHTAKKLIKTLAASNFNFASLLKELNGLMIPTELKELIYTYLGPAIFNQFKAAYKEEEFTTADNIAQAFSDYFNQSIISQNERLQILQSITDDAVKAFKLSSDPEPEIHPAVFELLIKQFIALQTPVHKEVAQAMMLTALQGTQKALMDWVHTAAARAMVPRGLRYMESPTLLAALDKQIASELDNVYQAAKNKGFTLTLPFDLARAFLLDSYYLRTVLANRPWTL